MQPNEEQDTLNDGSGKRKRNSVQRHVLSRVQEHLLKSLFSMPRTNKDPPRFLLHLRSSARSLWTYIYSQTELDCEPFFHMSYLMWIIDFKLLLRHDILCEKLMNVWLLILLRSRNKNDYNKIKWLYIWILNVFGKNEKIEVRGWIIFRNNIS